MSAFGNLSGFGAELKPEYRSYQIFEEDLESGFNSRLNDNSRRGCQMLLVGLIDAYTHYGQHLAQYNSGSNLSRRMAAKVNDVRSQFARACMR